MNDLRSTLSQEIEAAGGAGDSGKLAAALERIHELEEQVARTRVPGEQADVDAEVAALRGEVESLHQQLERDRALLKRARGLLGKQLEAGIDEDE